MQNLVVGVVVDDFSKNQKEETGTGLLTYAQIQWIDAMKAMARQTPQRDLPGGNSSPDSPHVSKGDAA